MTVHYAHLAPKHTLAAIERLDARTETASDTTSDTTTGTKELGPAQQESARLQ
jgi:hypothetical protein